MRLAALSLSTGGKVVEQDLPVLTDDRYALDYLLNEVLDRVPLTTQRLFVKTSIADRLSGPLCDALAGLARDDSNTCRDGCEKHTPAA